MNDVADTPASVAELVSIIVPVYNSAGYLRRCVESVIDQSYTNIEIILINDGSTDRSGEVCDAYALSDNRIRVIHTQNRGQGAARNTGIEASTGSFVFFVDSDDFVESGAVGSLVEATNKRGVDLAIGCYKKVQNSARNYGHDKFFANDKVLHKKEINEYLRSYLKKPNRFSLFMFIWGRLYKLSIIKEHDIRFNEKCPIYEDVLFNLDYLEFTEAIYYIDRPLYNYCVHDTYSSAGMKYYGDISAFSGYKLILENVKNHLSGSVCDEDVRKEVGHAYVFKTIMWLVKICRYDRNLSRGQLYNRVATMISDAEVRKNLQYYCPSDGDSRILPILMKLKLVWLIVLVSMYKAYRRYGKGSAA